MRNAWKLKYFVAAIITTAPPLVRDHHRLRALRSLHQLRLVEMNGIRQIPIPPLKAPMTTDASIQTMSAAMAVPIIQLTAPNLSSFISNCKEAIPRRTTTKRFVKFVCFFCLLIFYQYFFFNFYNYFYNNFYYNFYKNVHYNFHKNVYYNFHNNFLR